MCTTEAKAIRRSNEREQFAPPAIFTRPVEALTLNPPRCACSRQYRERGQTEQL
ncbi:MAG: hypothetical protein JWM57_3731 [Phycisphaerales bacterium]|nr:hypothetical protein [Phycisphaerales bacterium]